MRRALQTSRWIHRRVEWPEVGARTCRPSLGCQYHFLDPLSHLQDLYVRPGLQHRQAATE